MSARRLKTGGSALDRSSSMTFTFDGRDLTAFAGDTIASALLANGVDIVGRSFKYHRPRGIWGSGVEEPNALVDIAGEGGRPNVRATTEPVRDGLSIRSVNAHPTAAADRHGFLDRFSRFIPAAFYYKTFMFPDWHLFEPRIREMAGLGRLDPAVRALGPGDQVDVHCDVLVVGGGAAGLLAALAAAEAGKSVILCQDDCLLGGALLHREVEIDGVSGPRWAARVRQRLAALGVTILVRTTAFGIYDHGLVALNQRLGDKVPDRLWRVRPHLTILATGAIERPLPFANNDLPGIMSAEAALVYLRRYGVLVGDKVVIATNNGFTREVATALAKQGVEVTLVDHRAGARPRDGLRSLEGRTVARATGRRKVDGVILDDGTRLAADSVLVSGGYTPTIHLYCQAQGRLAWNDGILGFVPDGLLPGVKAVGAASGRFDLPAILDDVRDVLGGVGIAVTLPRLSGGARADTGIVAAWPRPKTKGRVWIDLQNDVTAKDVELAARENFVSVEHLKRYTTLGMATDQGKTSNLNGLALMAQLTQRSIPEVGTTTYRPPFTPVPMMSFAGMGTGEFMNPPRRLALEAAHLADGAVMQEYGGWLRPAWYGSGEPATAIAREVTRARRGVALFDGSPLGKIEVGGPQAAAFMDFIYYNTMSTLKPGHCRYGFILHESGIVFDDGVLVRLSNDHFVVSCSSSHVRGIHALLEEWRQDRFDREQLFIHDATADTATLTVSGPKSKALLEALDLGLALDDEILPHMATGWGNYRGIPLRVTRVSFTGDRSYELSIRADRAGALWADLKRAGSRFEVVVMGVEALLLMRAEKGYIIIGKDTDGMTRPMDLGVVAPLTKKKVDFLGRRSLMLEEAQRSDRKQFVGLEVIDGGPAFATGAHGVEVSGDRVRSLGYVTSSYDSPTLGRPIALALIERGASRMGEVIDVQHLGRRRKAKIAQPCAYNLDGGRLHA
ncbi:MAG: 2Fe-2S iron-sulfur cluster-binding protein [Methylorubrum populi]